MPKGRPYKDGDRAGAQWLPDEDDELLNLYLAYKPLKPLAIKAGRTVKALERRIWALVGNYRDIAYMPIERKDRTGTRVTARDQNVVAWAIKKAGMASRIDADYIAKILARSKDEVERLLLGRKRPRDQESFNL